MSGYAIRADRGPFVKLGVRWLFTCERTDNIRDTDIHIGSRQNTYTKGVGHKGRVVTARLDETKGLVLEPPPP